MYDGERMSPVAKLGDIITIEGYGDLLFRVFNVSYSVEENAIDKFEDVYYDVVSLRDGEFVLADHYDATIVDSPAVADLDQLIEHFYDSEQALQDTLTSLGMNESNIKHLSDKYDIVKEDVDMSESNAIDKILDEINDWKELIEIVGEDKNYREHIARLENEMKNIVEADVDVGHK